MGFLEVDAARTSVRLKDKEQRKSWTRPSEGQDGPKSEGLATSETEVLWFLRHRVSGYFANARNPSAVGGWFPLRARILRGRSSFFLNVPRVPQLLCRYWTVSSPETPEK